MSKSEYMKGWRERNSDRVQKYQKEWRENNSNHIKEYTKEYYDLHRDELIAKQSEYARKEANRERKRVNQNRRNAAVRERVLDIVGRKCARCGFDDVRALQLDHINGGGIQHKKQFARTTDYYEFVIESGGVGFQTLCANCNWIKRYENDELGNIGKRKAFVEE